MNRKHNSALCCVPNYVLSSEFHFILMYKIVLCLCGKNNYFRFWYFHFTATESRYQKRVYFPIIRWVVVSCCVTPVVYPDRKKKNNRSFCHFFFVVVELKWQDIRRTQSTPLLYVRLAQPLDNEMKLYRHTAHTERESFGSWNHKPWKINRSEETHRTHTHMTNYHNCISRLDI
jgi:hypothetical protein